MMRFSLLLLLLLAPQLSIADSTEVQLKNFLKSRTVIEQIFFNPSSTQLTRTAIKRLDSLVTKIQKINSPQKLFRIEGFSSQAGDKNTNVNLSMNRAIKVRNYLRAHYGLHVEIFLTGFGGVPDVKGEGKRSRRVDIAVYDKPEAADVLFDDQGIVDKIVIK